MVKAIAELLTKIFDIYHDNDSVKYLKEMRELEDELDKELFKPMDKQNDQKVEEIKAKIKNLQPLAIAQLDNIKQLLDGNKAS